jgi:hypothetical protein
MCVRLPETALSCYALFRDKYHLYVALNASQSLNNTMGWNIAVLESKKLKYCVLPRNVSHPVSFSMLIFS